MAKVGRPTKYKKKYCKELIDYMAKGYSLIAFAGEIGVNPDTIHEWIKVHSEFSDAYKIGRAKSAKYYEAIGILGMNGKIDGFNATSWIFNMKNRHNWTDRVETTDTVDRKIVNDAEDELKKEDPEATLGKLLAKYSKRIAHNPNIKSED